MTPYEYLTVFVSVVVGLAIVHLLSGVALILDTRVKERVDWIHAVWTGNIFVTTLLVWWFNFGLASVEVWTLPHFLTLVAYAVVLYLLAGLLYPVRGSEIVDFREHFEANRPRFFGLAIAFQFVDLADALLERSALGTPLNPLHSLSLVAFGAAFLVATRTSNRVFHGALAVTWLVVCLGWGVGGLQAPISAPGGDFAGG